MSEPEFVLVSAEEQARAERLELPSSLPVLPLMETVVLPGTMTPLAIGQQRSLELIEDVVASDRLVALVSSASSPSCPTGLSTRMSSRGSHVRRGSSSNESSR